VTLAQVTTASVSMASVSMSTASVSMAVSSSVSVKRAWRWTGSAGFRADLRLEAARASIVLSLSHQLGVSRVSVVASAMGGLAGWLVSATLACLDTGDVGGEMTRWPFLVSTLLRHSRLVSINSSILPAFSPLLVGSDLASLMFLRAVCRFDLTSWSEASNSLTTGSPEVPFFLFCVCSAADWGGACKLSDKRPRVTSQGRGPP